MTVQPASACRPRPHRWPQTPRRVITALLAAALMLTMAGPAPGAPPPVPVQTALINRTASSLTVLVNKTYPLSPITYAPTNLVTADNYPMRPETAAAWSRLKKDAAARGHSLRMLSAYRSYSYQRDLHNRYVREYGQAYADRISARPGHSEHQTGLAIDIGLSSGACQLASCFGDTAAGKWVAANAWRYGLILRYPQGTESVTGYLYEPWHFRYVGPSLASELQTRSIALLERYFDGSNPSIPSPASLSYSTDGTTRVLPATYLGGYGTLRTIPAVPGGAATFLADWNADGIQDVVAYRSSGRVVVALGQRGGGFQTEQVVARGMTGRVMDAGPWGADRGDRLVSVTADGTVYLHSHGTLSISSSTRVGRIAPATDIFMADMDGNGTRDLVARRNDGTLWAHPTTSAGNFTGSSHQVGRGWYGYDALHVVPGFDGPGTQTLVSRTVSSGRVHARTISAGSIGTARLVARGLTDAMLRE